MDEVYSSDETYSSPLPPPYIFLGYQPEIQSRAIRTQTQLSYLKSECDLASSGIKHRNNKARRIWLVSDSQCFWVSNSQIHSEQKKIQKKKKNQAKAEARCCFLTSSLAKVTAPLPLPSLSLSLQLFCLCKTSGIKTSFQGL